MTKIMLVEDDNNLREIYQARLEAEGYEIVSVQDGEAALAIASQERPDLVISDVMMPKISGFEMLDILRNTDALKNVKVIMLTALGQTEDSARASSLGADRYLVKSQVTLEDIVKATHDLLEGPATPAPAPVPVQTPVYATAPASSGQAPAPQAATPAPVQIPVSGGPAGQPISVVEPPVFAAAAPTAAQQQYQPGVTAQQAAAPVQAASAAAAQPSHSAGLSASDHTRQADAVMTTALSGLSGGGHAMAQPPSQVPQAAGQTNQHDIGAETSGGQSEPSYDDNIVEASRKKVIEPLHSTFDKPDINKLLELENAKAAAQQAAGASGQTAPIVQMPAAAQQAPQQFVTGIAQPQSQPQPPMPAPQQYVGGAPQPQTQSQAQQQPQPTSQQTSMQQPAAQQPPSASATDPGSISL